MSSLLVFNYCAIPIYLIILATTFIRRTTKGTANKWFILLTCLALATTLVDLVADGYEYFLPLTETQRFYVSLANYIYFALRNSTVVIYLFFLTSITHTRFRLYSKLSKVLTFIPYLIIIALLVSNPFHHQVFEVTCEEGYVRRPLIAVLYVVSICYTIAGIVYLLSNVRVLNHTKWLALMSMYFLSIIGILIQLIFPNILVEIYSTAISFLIVILLVLRPEEITDANVGLPSWKAYKDELNKITKINHRVEIGVIHYTNAEQLRSYLGEQRYNSYIMQIATAAGEYFRTHDMGVEAYYEAPGNFYLIYDDDNKEIDPIREYKEITNEISIATKEIESMGVALHPTMCSISYPKDAKTAQEIITLGHTFPSMLKEGEYYIEASKITGTKQYKIETDLMSIVSRAIAERRFEVYYQPIYNIKTGKFTAAEALLRLTDEKHGVIAPEIFIPAAEQSGLIIPIGDFMLETIYRFISENDFAELGLEYIEINLSVGQCFQIDLFNKIILLQRKYNVSPSNVNFEITETTYDDIGNVGCNNINLLVHEGYKFSLDDYGTGYSNIKRTVKLPVSLIKLDKSLIDDIMQEEYASVVRNTIKMMKDIHKHVLAEGVETQTQFECLKEMDCDYIQGYYFSKPLSEKDFIAFLKK